VGDKGDNTLHANAIGWAILLAVFAVLLWLFWNFAHTEIRDIVRWIRYYEARLISFFVDQEYKILFGDRSINFQNSLRYIPKYPKEDLSFTHLALFSTLVTQPLKLPIVIILSIGGVWAMFSGPGTQYRKKLDLQGLIDRQSLIFPVIAPFIKFNPSTQPPRAPGSPENWHGWAR
jgi:intracellular multiplication protein IcmP